MLVPCRGGVSAEQGELLTLDNLSSKLGTPVTMHTSSPTLLSYSFSTFSFS